MSDKINCHKQVLDDGEGRYRLYKIFHCIILPFIYALDYNKKRKRNTSEVPSSEVVEGVFSETGSINEVSADIITEKMLSEIQLKDL